MSQHAPPGHPNDKLTLTVVVNGTPTSIERNPNAALASVVERALEQTGNVGQPMENWELRDSSGTLLDLRRKVGDFGFANGVTLFLSLRAGVGG